MAKGRVLRNYYYSPPEKIDLSKLREEAARYSTQDDKFNRPQTVMIHHHPHGQPCNDKCERFDPK